MKTAIIIGHDPINQGARSFNGYTEWSYWLTFCMHYLNELENCEFFLRKPGTYKQSITQLVSEVKEYKADFAVELHFNAFNGRVEINRAEVLKIDNNLGLNFASTFSDEMKEVYKTDTKIIEVGNDDRGYFTLKSFQDKKIPAVILEPFFGDTSNRLALECMTDREKLAEVIARSIRSV